MDEYNCLIQERNFLFEKTNVSWEYICLICFDILKAVDIDRYRVTPFMSFYMYAKQCYVHLYSYSIVSHILFANVNILVYYLF